MEKKRVFYLDFIRAISIIIIVVYHFNCHFETFNITGLNGILFNFANGDVGKV